MVSSSSTIEMAGSGTEPNGLDGRVWAGVSRLLQHGSAAYLEKARRAAAAVGK